MTDWSRPAEPEPAEVICVLELIDFTRGHGGPSLTGKARERALDRMAAHLAARGVPYIRGGVRYGIRDELVR